MGQGDEVIASTLTFIGSVTPVVFQGASLVFVDCDRTSWNMDPDLLKNALEDCKSRGKMPKAVVPTDLYGQCVDYERILGICEEYGVPLVADAAEALGAFYLTQRRRDANGEQKKIMLYLAAWREKITATLGLRRRRRSFRLTEIRLLQLRAGGCWLRMIRDSLIMPAIFRNRPGRISRTTSIQRLVIIIV